MSRSGYIEPGDPEEEKLCNIYRGTVKKAIKGKRGQAILKELLAHLDAMPVKELIANDFASEGSYCSLGLVGEKRGLDLSGIDPEDDSDGVDKLASMFNIDPSLVREIMFINDEIFTRQDGPSTLRWITVRNWVSSQIK